MWKRHSRLHLALHVRQARVFLSSVQKASDNNFSSTRQKEQKRWEDYERKGNEALWMGYSILVLTDRANALFSQALRQLQRSLDMLKYTETAEFVFQSQSFHFRKDCLEWLHVSCEPFQTVSETGLPSWEYQDYIARGVWFSRPAPMGRRYRCTRDFSRDFGGKLTGQKIFSRNFSSAAPS